MLDIKIIRQDPDMVRDVIKKRNLSVDLDSFLVLDARRIELIQKTDGLRERKNTVSKEIPLLSGEEKPLKIAEMKQVWADLKVLEWEQNEVEQQWKDLYYQIPNILDPSAAIWNTDEDNIVETQHGEPTVFDFDARPHYEIGEKKGWIDTQKWSEVSGARFWYLKGDLVLLQFALIQYAMSVLTEKWFNPIIPPVLVREQAMFGTGYFPAGEDGLYRVNPDEDDLHLVGTSEVPVTSYHCNETIDLEQPKLYAAYSSCFRREAGSAWKDTRGILRWHQFDKVEMVSFCKPEESGKVHDMMIDIEEKIWQGLEIPYQKMNVCSGDLWNPAMKKFDLEAWMPGQQKYREVTSCSNVWEYQSRRLAIKYKDEKGKSQFVHTLNGTVIAMSRCMIALIENHQTANGDVKIPAVLQAFMWGKTQI
jgi:seryl-tRNA synthetase